MPQLKKRAKERERTAKISAYEDKARTGTESVKNLLMRGTGKNWKCPYCCASSDPKNAHADHIHPISKGGLTVPENMVLICQKCNLSKSNKALRVFCRETGLVLQDVYDRLERLGKDV